MSTMIQGVKEYIAVCPLLKEIPVKGRHVDWTSGDADNYGIMLDSDNLVKPFISGGGKYEYNFTLFVRKFAKEDADRLANTEFVERLQDWCSKQNAVKNFPAMPKGCTPTKLSCANGMLYDRDKAGNTGLYQIQFKLNYIRSGG